MPDDISGPNRFARDLFAPLPARYDRLAELLSFGQNGQWRAAMVGHVVPADGVILDVASGTAGVALQLAARSRARVVGVDLTEQMLRQGRRRVAAAGTGDRVVLVAGRAEQLPFPDGYFDPPTFTYLLRYVQGLQATLTELARVLKPGGTMASLEFCVPDGPVWGPWVGVHQAGAARRGPGAGRSGSGSGWGVSWARTSRLTTAATRSPGPSRPGRRRAWSTWAPGSWPRRWAGHVGQACRR